MGRDTAGRRCAWPVSEMGAASWRLALTLARRELRGGLQGFRIFLACLVLGVAAIAAVQSLSAGILDGLRRDGRAILGGDVALRQLYQPVPDPVMEVLRDSGPVSTSAEMRAMVRSADESHSALVELKAVDGAYPLAGSMMLDGGERLHPALTQRDGYWGAVAEQGLMDRLGAKVGDTLRLGETEVQVRAVIAREPDRASGGGFTLGPRLMISLAALPDTRLHQPGSLIWWGATVRLPDGTDVKAWQAALTERFPGAPWRMRDVSNAAPQIQTFIERMNTFLTLVGLTSLLVGGVGVGNAVRAHLDARGGTIATLKCLGAPGALVFRVYLLQIMILAGLGVAGGLMVGAAAPPLLGGLLEGLLPVSLHVGVYPGALAAAVVFGFLTALAFSLWPLGRAREVPAGALFRDAIAPAGGRPRAVYLVLLGLAGLGLAGMAVLTAHEPRFALWFVAGAVAALAVFRLAAWAVVRGAAALGRPRSPGLRLALANLHRPGNPTGAVVMSLGLGLTVLVIIALIQGNFSRRVQETIPDGAPSFFFVDIQPDQFAPFKDTVLAVPGTTAFEAVPSLRGRIETINGQPAEQALKNKEGEWLLRGDRGLTYAAEPPAHGSIIQGQWWARDYRGAPLVSIHTSVAEAFGVGLGDRIGVNVLGRLVEAEVASVRAADFASLTINFALVFSPGLLDGAPQTWIATVRAPVESEQQVQRAVLQRFPNITAVRIKDALDTVGAMLGHIGMAVRVIAAITLLAGTLVLAGAVAAGHRRRTYDAVVLKVLGATRGDVVRAFLLEYGLLGLITAVIASVIGTLAAWAVLVWVMRWDWAFLPSAVGTTAAVATAITLALGFYGTWRALGQPAAPLLRNE
ncbi:putative ABC transport system permease protein [Azospirillum fermentarium]|uniref:ABC transporter permease n=1 Tax=Azospirillum fermentarium TaxID=1233114 RepID=UPI0029CABBEA|nr:FtsX-like permease family protein [Azospirillum fermentarium]MCW2248664.1 putative ABC transport system permease protein [Azospirillum fermentarium]